MRSTAERTLRRDDGSGVDPSTLLVDGPGEAHIARGELAGDAASLAAPGHRVLLRLLHLSDLHVIDAPYGHDCFLLEEARQTPMIQDFLAR